MISVEKILLYTAVACRTLRYRIILKHLIQGSFYPCVNPIRQIKVCTMTFQSTKPFVGTCLIDKAESTHPVAPMTILLH